MPQITLEYTDNIKDSVEFNALFHELHKTINQIAGVKIDNCKSRARKLDCYYVGTGGDEKAFINFDLFFLEGRTSEVKKSLGEAILKLLKDYHPQSIKALDLQITVRIEDIKRDIYFKYPTGTFTPMGK